MKKHGRLKRLFLVVFFCGVIAVIYSISSRKTPSSEPAAQRAVRSVEPATLTVHLFKYAGPVPQHFNEAPVLGKRVAAGKLPPVSERLPQEPLVIPPVERIGEYGGTWRRAFTGPADGQSMDRILHDHVIYYDMDGLTPVPHIAKSWQVSDDARVFTFKLRRGMKWSDGAPFTADDFVFAYEDMMLNDELWPAKPDYMMHGGELGRVEKLDDHTVRYVFAEPYPVFLEIYAGSLVAGQSLRGRYGGGPYAPRHYLKQFHPKYVSQAQLAAKVRQAGAGTWVQLFKRKANAAVNLELPAVGPWKVVSPITAQRFVLERNPYYWAVDPQGNQLPYIDRIVMSLAENLEVLNLRAIAGEIDMQHRHIELAKVPVLKANARRGDYRVLLWPGRGGTECAIYVNQTWQGDAEVERWLRSRDFRIALSLAIDREEINETIFLGTGKPGAFVPAPEVPFYPGEEYGMKYAVRDVGAANELLDRLGLEKKDSKGFRLRTGGKRRLILELSTVSAAFLDYAGVAELLRRHWAEVGIAVSLSIEERSRHFLRVGNNEQQLSLWAAGSSENLWLYPSFVIPMRGNSRFAPLVGLWYQSTGKKGMAPWGGLKRLLELFDQGKRVPFEQRVALGQEIWRILADNLYAIGTVGQSPAHNGVVVVKNNFRNVPELAPNSVPLQNPGIARPEQFFFQN